MTKRGWLALCVLYIVALLGGAAAHLAQPEGLTAATVATDVFARFFPLQYQSYLKNAASSTHESKLTATPYLKVVYQEHGFSVEYNTTRGHVYSLDDVLATARGKGPACLICKTPQAHAAIAAAKPGAKFADIAAQTTEPVNCANCHNPLDMSLRITNQALLKAVTETGRSAWLKDRSKMRILVCAQCHIEYYCPATALVPVIPWGAGLDPAAIEQWEKDAGIVDWVHPLAGTALLKVQHPEFEMFQGGVHAKLGVACADCHMPKVVTAGKEHTSHWWTSPYEHIQQSCATCHPDVASIETEARAKQAEVEQKTQRVGEALAALAERLAAAPEGQRKEQARELYARAHFRWDWVFCENSTGFHNFNLANGMLDEALAQIGEAAALLPK